MFRDAAINDLEFCKNVKLYEQVNEKMAKCALTKFCGQSWYLGPELAVFALFSDKVTDREKVDMIMKMKKSDGHWKKSLIPDTSDIDQKNITDFINSRSLFSIHKINPDVFKFMLHNHPSVWKSDPDFRKVIISFVNDVAERYIAKKTIYNGVLSYSENESQNIMQVSEEHCNRYTKKTKNNELF